MKIIMLVTCISYQCLYKLPMLRLIDDDHDLREATTLMSIWPERSGSKHTNQVRLSAIGAPHV